MLDFTSALYLGMRHPSWLLGQWSQFTMGVPAALRAPFSAQIVAEQIAALQGCEAGTLGASTLHLFWDLFGILAQQRIAIYLDRGTYPIARWGVDRATARRVSTRGFTHHDVDALRQQLKRDAWTGTRPVVVTDGFCPGCGKPAPLAEYVKAVRALDGYLVLDDTQALGIFGRSPGPKAPFGIGGGGMLPWYGIHGADIIVVSSMAKAFGVPVAVLGGSKVTVRDFEEKSETRVHCSPASIATIHAAEHALATNFRCGEALRLHLARLVSCFREAMGTAGFRFVGELFPVQTLELVPELDARVLYERLLRDKVCTVLHASHKHYGARISFLVTARHALEEIVCAVEALAEAAAVPTVHEIVGGDYEMAT